MVRGNSSCCLYQLRTRSRVQYIQNTKGLILIDFSIIMTVFILYLIIYSVFVTVYVFQLNESGVGKEIVIVLF